MTGSYVDILVEVEKEITAELRVLLSAEIAESIAERVTQRVREHWGGDKHYVKAPSKRKRNRQIVLDWLAQRKSGYDNRAELAQKYTVHVTTINRVIAKYLNRNRAVQGGLVDGEWDI